MSPPDASLAGSGDTGRYSAALGALLPSAQLQLCDGGWASPVAIVDAPDGFGEETWSWENPDLLAWILRGSVISENPGRVGLTATQGDQTVSLQPRRRSGRYRAEGGVCFAHFYLSEDLLVRTAEGLNLPRMTLDGLRDDIVLETDRALVGMLDTYKCRSLDAAAPPSRIEMEARALLITEHVVRVYHAPKPPATARGGLAPWQLRRACQALEAHLDRDIGLDVLADAVGCSPTHFSRAFRQSTGVPPFTWLLHRRIDRAKDLLGDPRNALAEVALAVGFAAQPQFTTAFKRVTGATPGAWRRERLM